MALGSLPPWLAINPRDFLLATQAGVQAGHAIADSATRAFEEQQRMQMAQERQKQVLDQQAIENAANRLAAERLEQYRQSEVANRQAQLALEQKGLGLRGRAADTAEGRLGELQRHNQAMEEARLNAAKEAGIATLPGAPGFTFLRNPSGAMTPLVRPIRAQSPLENARLQLTALNSMAPRGGEDPTSQDYQTRTNAVGQILSSLRNQVATYDPAPAVKDRKVNVTYKTPKGLFTWTASGWTPASSIPSTPTDDQEPDDGE